MDLRRSGCPCRAGQLARADALLKVAETSRRTPAPPAVQRDASPVAHAYHWSSINYINQGGYPVTLTVDWPAQFSANGGGFQGIPDVIHTFEGHQQVRQIQSIVTQ